MGLFTLLKTKYTADIGDHKRKIKDLTGEEKKLAKARLDGLNDTNEKLDLQIAKYAKYAAAVAAVAGAAKLAKESFSAFATDAQLRAAAAGTNMEALRKSSRGLASDLNLLTFAAAAQNTQFKLSQKEMEEVQKFMLVLRAQGNDYAEVQREVTKTLVEGSVEGLKKFGVVMQEVSDKAENHRNVMERIREENDKFSGSLDIAGDDVKRFGVEWDNFTRDMKVGIGEVMLPLVRELARELRMVANAASEVADKVAFAGGNRTSLGVAALGGKLAADADLALEKARKARIEADKDLAKVQKPLLDKVALIERMIAAKKAQFEKDELDKALGRGKYAPGEFVLDTTETSLVPTAPDLSVTGGIGRAGFLPSNLEIERQRTAEAFAAFDIKKNLADPMDKILDRLKGDKQASFLQAAFGPVSEFNAYKDAFNALTQSVAAAFSAWATGSKSAGAAFKETLHQAAAAAASQMLVEALKHGAYALGYLAFSRPDKAAQHGIAAAKFGAGAAIAAGIARKTRPDASLGASGTVPSSLGTASSTGMGDRSTTINYFGGFTDDDPPERRASQFKRLLDRARDGGDDTIVVAS